MAELKSTIVQGNLRVTDEINAGAVKVNGTNVLTSHQSVSSSNNTASWGSAVTVGTVGGTDLKFTMPSNPNTNYYHTTGSWNGLTYTATANGGAGALAFTIPTGTTASSVCVGNDSRLSDARPASDVYSWAKASTKPSYNFGEIGAGNITIGDGTNVYYYRTGSGVKSGFYYHTTGDESVVFANQYANTGWMFVEKTNPENRTNWQSLSPTLQIKKGGVVINKLIGQGASPAYNLDVNGTMNATTIYQNGTALATVATSGSYNDLSNKPTIPSSFSITVTDDILDGTGGANSVKYAPYTSQQSGLTFDTSSTTPTGTSRLNLNGKFYATEVYAGTTKLTGNSGTITGVSVNGTSVATSGVANITSIPYSIISNPPTIPATNVIPVQTTANKVLLSTTTSGTAAWSSWSSAGFLKTNTSGVVSVDTTSYLPLTGGTLSGDLSISTSTSVRKSVTVNQPSGISGDAGSAYASLTTTAVSNGSEGSLELSDYMGTATKYRPTKIILQSGYDLSFPTLSANATIATQAWVGDQSYVTSSSLSSYLPLSAGASYPLTGQLKVKGSTGNSNGIKSNSGGLYIGATGTMQLDIAAGSSASGDLSIYTEPKNSSQGTITWRDAVVGTTSFIGYKRISFGAHGFTNVTFSLPLKTADDTFAMTSDLSYITTAPSSANTSGQIKIVVLSSEPSTKYDGYIYIITN